MYPPKSSFRSKDRLIYAECPNCRVEAWRTKTTFTCPKCKMDVGTYIFEILKFHYPEITKKEVFDIPKREKMFSPFLKFLVPEEEYIKDMEAGFPMAIDFASPAIYGDEEGAGVIHG